MADNRSEQAGRGAAAPSASSVINVVRDAAFVLDSPALLAYLRGDPGGALVQRVLRQCQDTGTNAVIAASALQDVYAEASRETPGVLDELIPLVEQLPLAPQEVTSDNVRRVADSAAHETELTGGQTAGLALSQLSGATLVTADPALKHRRSVLYVGPKEAREGVRDTGR